MRNLPIVIERDFRSFMRWRSLLIMRWVFVAVQIAIFGLVLSRLVIAMENYFQYYAMGVVVMTLYSVAAFIGYQIYDEADHGIVEYLLSLPLTRRELIVGRSIAGGLRGLAHIAPIMIGLMIFLGIANPLNYLAAFLSLFLFAMGISGLSIMLAVGLKSGDKFDILMGLLDALIVRLSTAIYPKAFMPQPILAAAELNPLTYASDLFRWILNFDAAYLADPLTSVVALLAFLLAFNLAGLVMYERVLEGGGWR